MVWGRFDKYIADGSNRYASSSTDAKSLLSFRFRSSSILAFNAENTKNTTAPEICIYSQYEKASIKKLFVLLQFTG